MHHLLPSVFLHSLPFLSPHLFAHPAHAAYPFCCITPNLQNSSLSLGLCREEGGKKKKEEAPFPTFPSSLSHFFLSAPDRVLSVESAHNEDSCLSGVKRRRLGRAERVTFLGYNANILPSSKLNQNVNCAIAAMADTDRSLAWVEFGQPPRPREDSSCKKKKNKKTFPTQSLLLAGQVFCS